MWMRSRVPSSPPLPAMRLQFLPTGSDVGKRKEDLLPGRTKNDLHPAHSVALADVPSFGRSLFANRLRSNQTHLRMPEMQIHLEGG